MADDKFTRDVDRLTQLAAVVLPQIQAAIDHGFQQGQRDVYAAILKRFPKQIEPWYGIGREWGTYCLWCETMWQPTGAIDQHPENDCLWLRAKAAVLESGANHEP